MKVDDRLVVTGGSAYYTNFGNPVKRGDKGTVVDLAKHGYIVLWDSTELSYVMESAVQQISALDLIVEALDR